MNSLKLKCIKLHNFKSFLGTHTIDCLNNHLNIITGPNGSGKSNILDAMLFVLGFKAKKLRHTNQADLIHYDSTDKICFVELVFEVFDTDKILLNSQENLTNKLMSKNKIYSVKRQLILKNKSIKNTYFLNNQEIKLPDLTTFFKKYLDLENNRFLILQGEIESISLMKPKKTPTSLGMLEYLEEIIGTTFLNDKIEQLSEHINKMKEENERKASEFKFYEKEMKYLEERKEKEEIQEYFNQLELEVKINKLTLKRNNLEIEESEKIILNLENKLKNQKNELKNQEKLKIKEEKKVNSLYKILKEKEEIFLKFNQEKKKKEELINKKNKKEEKINELKKEINELEIKEKEVKKEINEINEKINENNKIIKEIKEEIGKNENKIKKSNELENKKNEINNKINEVNLVIKSKEALINKLNSQKKEKDEFNPKLIDQLKERMSELENDFETTLKELTKQKINLKESLSYQSNNKVDLVIKNIPGVLGRLSDLGSVEEKYEVAVSAAGRGSLNFIVVTDSSVAEKCAEKVKQMKNKVTFIILDKISEIPDFIHSTNEKYLVNLINCDNKIKKCFYFAIKDTLLANDLEEGKKLAYSKERRRVVTLDGKLIEKSGLMCKSIPKKGNLFNKSKKYEKNVNELEKVIQKIKEEIKSVSEQININLTKSKQINQSENDQKRIKELKNELTTHQSLFTKLTQQLIKLEKEIEEDKRNLLGKDYNKLINLENKEEELELNNQKLKLRKEEIKIQDYSFKLKELIKLQNELNNIPNILPIKNEESEKEYKKILKEYELVNKNYLEIKDLFDKLYYEKLDLKSMIDNKGRLLKHLREKNSKIECEVSKGVKEINKINNIINSNNNMIDNTIDNNNININSDINSKENMINNNNISKEDIISNITVNIIDKEIKNLLKKLRKSEIKQIDFDLIEEYFKKNKEFIKIKENYFNYLALLQEKTKELNLSLEKRLTLFNQGLSEINNNLKDVYQTITFGGNAELELVDSLDPFSEGILFSVMPPKKVWRNIRNLSGGERTLASLSLVFALHLYKPSSFYVMDEIDAALDFKNVSIIANFIRERTKDSQFIIISLRNDMFEIGSTFVGVYKNNNKSEVFLINE